MPELLLEILSEEIPARMQARAAEDLKRLVTEKLTEAGLTFAKARAFATPRRLALVVDGLPERTPDRVEEKRGPRVGAPEQAIQGFLKGAGLDGLDRCLKKDTGKGEFWFAEAKIAGRETSRALAEIVQETVLGFSWPKSMRWAAGGLTWVRPIQSLVVVFDGRPLGRTIEVAEMTLALDNTTVGHRFLAPGEITVAGFADYQRKLKEAYVILDPAERREKIRGQAEALATQHGLIVKRDEALLDEVTGLVEWPVVLCGKIDPAFMGLPPEVLTTAMRAHQKYFALLGPDGKLASRFLVVANMETKDKGAAIVAGNERVLRARLADAKFFWDQDRKVKLKDRVPALKEIVFHAKLGTVADKMDRVRALAAEIAPLVGADPERVRLAASLAKADLTAGMVGEFPELQGLMGRYYALAEGEKPDVAEAIAEHYSPLGPNDRCPSAPLSIAVALADKFDTLVGFFAIDEKPTGSKDPFALRRAALGIVRLIVENGLRLPLAPVLGETLRLLRQDAKAPSVIAELLDFFADRLKVALREKGVRHDLIAAVFALGGEDDLVRLLARVDALKSFLDGEDGANLLTASKRAVNILRIEEKKDNRSHDGAADAALLKQDEERDLNEALVLARDVAARALKGEDFAAAMAALARLRRPVDAFFDRVTVNCPEAELRANRLRLLSRIRATLGTVADFSKIEG
jgi:glycyl-tRNA synthetase beta chain